MSVVVEDCNYHSKTPKKQFSVKSGQRSRIIIQLKTDVNKECMKILSGQTRVQCDRIISNDQSSTKQFRITRERSTTVMEEGNKVLL